MGELGFFSPGRSYLHRLHPAAKILVFAVAVSALPLWLRHWQSDAALALLLVAALVTARVGVRQVLYFSPALGLIVLVGVSWLFTGLGGAPVLDLRILGHSLVLRAGALQLAWQATLRAIVWVLTYVVLLTTTSARDLVAGLERLRVPRRAARAVGMTLKFWSNAIGDTRWIMDAQRVRGVEFDRGSRWRMLKQRFVVTAVPAIFLLLRRFRTLSYALALRGFGAPTVGKRIYGPPLNRYDRTLAAACLTLLALVVVIDGTVR